MKSLIIKLFITALSVISLNVFPAYMGYAWAVDENISEINDLEDGFEEDEFFEDPDNNNDTVRKDYSYFSKHFTFTLSHNLSFGTESSDFDIITNRSSLRCEFDHCFQDNLFVKFDGKTFFYLENDHYANAMDRDFDTDEEIREFYIQAGFDDFVIRAGKQIVVWGETDGDVINDVVSPRDETEFVFKDISDSRIGQYMLSADLYTDHGNLFTFLTFKPYPNSCPINGSRYYRNSAAGLLREEQTDFSDLEGGLKWSRIYDKFDLSIMAATLIQNKGVFEIEPGSSLYKKVYERYHFAGIGLSCATGNFLFKLDASIKNNHFLQTVKSHNRYSSQPFDILDSAFALEYDANGKYLITLELTNRHIIDFNNSLYGTRRDNTAVFFQYLKKIKNDTLEFKYNLYYQPREKNLFHKAECTYHISDEIILIVDYVAFHMEDNKSYLWSYRDEDRLGFEIKYCF